MSVACKFKDTQPKPSLYIWNDLCYSPFFISSGEFDFYDYIKSSIHHQGQVTIGDKFYMIGGDEHEKKIHTHDR